MRFPAERCPQHLPRAGRRAEFPPCRQLRHGHGLRPRGCPDLTVDGIEGLRVVDATVISTIVSDDTNIAAIMIAEKGADPIRGARRAPRTQKPGPSGAGLISRCFPTSASGAPSGPFPERAVPSAAPTSAAAARRCGNDQTSDAGGVEPRRRRWHAASTRPCRTRLRPERRNLHGPFPEPCVLPASRIPSPPSDRPAAEARTRHGSEHAHRSTERQLPSAEPLPNS